MTLFPLAAAVTVVLNGHPVRGYAGTFEADGHIYAPVRPYVTGIADRIWYSGDKLSIQRDGRTIVVPIAPRDPDALDSAFVPLRAVMTALGADVQYDAVLHAVNIRAMSHPVVALPTPFDALAPQAAPAAVFTPTPVPTPRPTWSGSPLPRRTPLPFTQPSPSGDGA